jgi:AcrR family transcriptional regulator
VVRVRREEFRRERRQAILEAAMKVLARRGYAAATIRTIAREVHITQGTVYPYFPSKRDILLALYLPMILESLEENLARPEKGDAEAFLRSLIVNRIGRFRRNAQAVRLAFTELPFHQELRERFYRDIAVEHIERLQTFLKDRIAKGELRPIRTEIADEAVRLFLNGALSQVPSQPRSTPERSHHATNN